MLYKDIEEIIVELDGETPISGTIIFSSGKMIDVKLYYENDYIVYREETGKLIYENIKLYKNGEEVYFNVTTGKSCLESEAVSTTGTKSGCMKFYAFNDKASNETINLILDHNTTTTVAWNSSGTNAEGPNEVLTQLYHDTKNWVGTIIPEDYTMDQSSQTSTANYTVKYSVTPSIEGATTPYKARLITAQEVAQITGADIALNWDETTSKNFYYLDGAKGIDETWQTQIANSTIRSDYSWLCDRTYDCE